MFKYLMLILFFCQLSGCEGEVDIRPTALDEPISEHSVIEERLVIERKKASQGDIESETFVLLWADNITQEEKIQKLAHLARKGSITASSQLYSAYLYGGVLGIQKDCNLANEWYLILKKNAPRVFVKSKDNQLPEKEISVYCPEVALFPIPTKP